MQKMIAAAMAFFITFAAAGAVQADKGTSKPQEQKATEAGPAAAMETDAVERHFQQAHGNFLKNESKAAAAEIREAASIVKKESENASGKAANDLKSAAGGLESLAEKMEKGTVTSAKDLENAFSRSHQALAEYYHQQASEHWVRKDTGKAGHELEAAANHLENAFAWSGHEMKAGTKEVVRGTRTVAEKLIEGAGWSAAEVGKAVKDIGNEIRRLG